LEKAAEKSGGLLVHRWSFIVSRFGCQMLTHLPLNMKNRRPGWASLRAAPTTLVSQIQREITETGLSKNPFL
jgi:hypothetical protein